MMASGVAEERLKYWYAQIYYTFAVLAIDSAVV